MSTVLKGNSRGSSHGPVHWPVHWMSQEAETSVEVAWSNQVIASMMMTHANERASARRRLRCSRRQPSSISVASTRRCILQTKSFPIELASESHQREALVYLTTKSIQACTSSLESRCTPAGENWVLSIMIIEQLRSCEGVRYSHSGLTGPPRRGSSSYEHMNMHG